MRRRALTLIELLIILAILAVLAAIMAPLPALAKSNARRATAITNGKQVATSLAIYVNDFDGRLPIAYVPNLQTPQEDYRFRPTGPEPAMVPAQTLAKRNIREEEDALFWINSTRPYRRTDANLSVPGLTRTTVWDSQLEAEVSQPLTDCHFALNGFLHAYQADQVPLPSTSVMLWQGFGNLTLRGAGLANPFLRCTGSGPCRYEAKGVIQSNRPESEPASGITTPAEGVGSHWVYGRTLLFVAMDTTARAVRVGGSSSAKAASSKPFRFDPFRRYSSTGVGTLPYLCGEAAYECTFQPDRVFNP